MSRELVVLLHGIWRTSRCMKKLEQALIAKGYEVLNVDYPSREHDLGVLTDHIWNDIKDNVTAAPKVHWAGFSMGGLLIRLILAKHTVKHMGRVVMMGTPNHGSELADALQPYWVYKKLYGPAGQQLTTRQEDIASHFKAVDYELGIIAGTLSIFPYAWFMLPGPNDSMVSVESTHLEGEKDHITLNVSHSFMPTDKPVIEQALHFFETGYFKR